MATGGLGFWGTTIAGVVSTLIAAVAIWLFGFWPIVWQWIADVTTFLWGWVTFTVPVPLGILIIVGIVLTLLCRKILAAHAQVSPSSAPVDAPVQEPALGQTEIAVIKLLAQADGAWLELERIARGIHSSRLVTERALEQLMSLDLLIDRLNMVHGPSFRLSSQGRDYALDHNLHA